MKAIVHLCFGSPIDSPPFSGPNECRCGRGCRNLSTREGESLEAIREEVLAELFGEGDNYAGGDPDVLERLEGVVVWEIVGSPLVIPFAEEYDSETDENVRPLAVRERFRAYEEKREAESREWARQRDLAEFERLKAKIEAASLGNTAKSAASPPPSLRGESPSDFSKPESVPEGNGTDEGDR